MKKLLSIISAFLFVFICAGCNAPKVECNSVVIQFSEDSASGILSLEPEVTANGGFKCAAKISGDYNSVKSKTYSNISELNNEKIIFDNIPSGSTVNILFELSIAGTVYYRGRVNSLVVTMAETFVSLDLYKTSGPCEIVEEGSSGYTGPVPEGFAVVNGKRDASFKMKIKGTVHNVSLTRTYFISDHEVTQAEYASVMGSYPSYGSSGAADGEDQDKRPVEKVNWYDALVYCNKRSISEGLTPCYSINGEKDPSQWGTVPSAYDATFSSVTCDWDADGYRLPTNAEWEYAARAGNYTITGPIYGVVSDINGIGEYAWYYGNAGDKTHEVKKKKPNAYGIYDMSGNVAEWCWDSEGSFNSSSVVDPTNPETITSSEFHVTKGGYVVSPSQNNSMYDVTNTGYSTIYLRSSDVGFRVVRTVVPSLTKIEITSLPEKTSYLLNETLNTNGISVKATYSDGSTEDVTSSVVYSGFDSTLISEELPVTVTFTKLNITQTVSFNVAILETYGTGNFNYTSAVAGDIVLKDGSLVSYENFDSTKMRAAAVIFREASDTKPALGVGLVESSKDVKWSTSASPAGTKTVTYMMKDSLTDGSLGWNLMVTASENGIINNPDYYTAWYFCKNYGTNNSLVTLKNKWYFPTVSELKEIYPNYSTINQSLEKVSGTKLGVTSYKTCNQNSTQSYIDTVNTSTGNVGSCQKYSTSNAVRAVRSFGKPKQWSIASLPVQTNLSINGISISYTGEAAVLTETKTIPHATTGVMFKEGRDITLSPYIMGKYEVTQKLFTTVMGYNPSLCNSGSSTYKPDSTAEIPNLPVDNVNWYEACAFCNELTKSVFGTASDKFVYYSDRAFTNVYTVEDAQNKADAFMKPGQKGFRLPTDAEWEYAARGGQYSSDAEYQYNYSGVNSNNTNSAWDSTIDSKVWYLFNLDGGNTKDGAGTQLTSGYQGFSTKRVGKKGANAAGIYDMSGNVCEWCYDKSGSLANPATLVNPRGPEDEGTSRLSRGSSWGNYAKDMQLYRRDTNPAGSTGASQGFRICRYAD